MRTFIFGCARSQPRGRGAGGLETNVDSRRGRGEKTASAWDNGDAPARGTRREAAWCDEAVSRMRAGERRERTPINFSNVDCARVGRSMATISLVAAA